MTAMFIARTVRHTVRRTVRHTVTGTAVGVAALGLLTATAGNAAAATSPFVIDTDAVRVSVAGAGQTWGTAYDTLAGRNVVSRYSGSVQHSSTGPGCVLVRAIYTYADGRTQTVDSPRACSETVSRRDFVLASSTAKDVVRYAIQLRGATDSTAPTSTLAGTTFVVGDAPDSLGTTIRLDHDTVPVTVRGTRVFRGTSDYGLTSTTVGPLTVWSVRSRVIGDLTWSDILPGSYARVQVIWTYSDGSTGTARSAKLYRGRGPAHVDVISDKYKDVVSVRIRVYTDIAVVAAAPDTKFGDHGRP